MAENEQELTREEQGLDPEPQDGPGDLDNIPEEDFESYEADDAEVTEGTDSPPVPAPDTTPPQQTPEPTADEEVENE